MKKPTGMDYVMEYRRRVDSVYNLLQITPDSKKEVEIRFFQEAISLINWVLNNEFFLTAVGVLEYQNIVAQSKMVTLSDQMKKEACDIWNKVKVIDLEKIKADMHAVEAYKNMAYMVEHMEKYSGMDLYHTIRLIIEGGARVSSSELFFPYLRYSLPDKVPLMSGEIYDHFLEYGQEEELYKKNQKTTAWGALDSMRYLSYLATGESGISLADWISVFHASEYYSYLCAFGNYCYDYYVLGKTDRINPEASGYWSDTFQLSNHQLLLDDLGTMVFDPEKNPVKPSDKPAPSPRIERVVGLIIKKGVEGVSIRSICNSIGMDIHAFSSDISHFNTRADELMRSGKLKAIVRLITYGKTKSKFVKMQVVPVYTPQKAS